MTYHITAGDFSAGIVTGESLRKYPSLRAAVADARRNERECIAREACGTPGEYSRDLRVRGPRQTWAGVVTVRVP